MLKKFRHIRVPKNVGWLIPGLEVKRWFVLILLGSFLILFGILILLNIGILSWLLAFAKSTVNYIPNDILALILIIAGMVLFFLGWQKTNMSIMDLRTEKDRSSVLEILYRRRKLNRGPHIVAIGGGTGLSMLLKGIKRFTNNITAVVTVGDDGGSSGRLREELGVLPPGDIRNCIAALADDEDLVTQLFQYRFQNGEGLEGHSFGNLFLTALCSITGDMVTAVKESSKVLSIRGVVLPATLDDMKLVAKFEDGRIIHGESNIPEAGGVIKRLYTEPEKCKPLPDVLTAIKGADLIILGPGSLYTSVIPNLLISEIAEAIAVSKAKKLYVCNIMTQPGETDDYTVSDHIKALIKHAGGKRIIDAVLVNNVLPDVISEGYAEAGSFPVAIDDDKLASLNIEIISSKLIMENKSGLVRHSSNRVARAIYYWFKKKNKKIIFHCFKR